MTDKSLVNILTDRSIPDFIQSDYPLFVQFIEAYNTWLEQSKYTHDIANNLREYRNIDTTLDEFIDYFRSEFLVNIPPTVLADKRLLVKHIRSFYANKGNEASYRFLFRILYNETVEFYYPKNDILRASDGKWYQQTSLRITVTNPETSTLLSTRRVVGLTSGASAIIESALNFTERGINIVELSLSDIRGTFVQGESIQVIVENELGELVEIEETIYDVYSSITITAGGSGYTIGDIFPIRDSDDNEIAKGIVRSVTRGPATTLTIDAAGTGYNGTEQEVDRFGALPLAFTLNGDYLPTTVADGSDSNSSGTDYSAYTFDEVIAVQTIAGTGDIITIIDGPNSFGSGGQGIVTLTGTNGEILEVELLSGGENYETPIAIIESDTGVDGEILIAGGGGSISTASLQDFPLVLPDDEDSNGYTVYPDFTEVGDGNATGTMGIGVLAQYPGRYLNEDGHLSSTKYLQDNFFYQDYSYVLKVGLAITEWRDIIKKIIHPAGLLVFGEIETIESISSIWTISQTNDVAITKSISSVGFMDESIVKLFSHDSNDNMTPIVDSNGNHLIDFEKDSSGEYVQT